jgi:anti-sigma regulatory factor (Ser/Thr protein kinase)
MPGIASTANPATGSPTKTAMRSSTKTATGSPINPATRSVTGTDWLPRPASDDSDLWDASVAELARWELPGRAKSVGIARAFLRLLLGPDDPQLETAQWLISELFTNSVIHSRSGSHPHGKVGVAVWRRPNGYLLVEVSDDGGETVPQDASGDLMAESGRGWQLVQAVARSCGSTTSGMGKRTTWFTLAVHVT